jgi:hypothetical protein
MWIQFLHYHPLTFKSEWFMLCSFCISVDSCYALIYIWVSYFTWLLPLVLGLPIGNMTSSFLMLSKKYCCHSCTCTHTCTNTQHISLISATFCVCSYLQTLSKAIVLDFMSSCSFLNTLYWNFISAACNLLTCPLFHVQDSAPHVRI